MSEVQPRVPAHKVLRKSRPFWLAAGFTSEIPYAFWDDDWYWRTANK